MPKNLLILVDQILSSGTNAVALIFSAVFLPPAELGTYAVLQLVATTVVAFQRSLIIEPSLSLSTANSPIDVSRRWTLVFWAPAVVVAICTFALFGNGLQSILLGLAIVLPGVQDLFRYRAFALRLMGRAALSDGIWLAVLVVGFAVLRPQDAFSAIVVWGIAGGVALVVLPLARRKGAGTIGSVFRLGRFQIVDWAFATATSSVPLFIVQAVLPFASVGAFRLAQTAMGPLNTINSYVTIRFLLDAGEIQALSAEESGRRIRNTNLVLSGITLLYGAALWIGYLLFGGLLDPGVANQMTYALPLTIFASVITAPCTAYIAYIRAMALQRFAIPPRIATLVVSGIALSLGLLLWFSVGLDPLVLPVVLPTTASLIAFWLTVRWIRARASRTGNTEQAAV